MNFKNWLINESSLRDMLTPVPQNPTHHSEGNVFVHTRMVRKSLDSAKSLLEKESNVFPFTNISFYLNEKEEKMLKICAWLHDIGKASATTIDGKHWSLGGNGKIQAIGHDKADHYMPNIDKIPIARKILDNLSDKELEDIYFCIDNHMGLRDGLFSKKIMSRILENNGNYKNERKIKLLLYLIVMDWCGRISGEKGGIKGGMAAVEGFKNSSNVYKEKNKRVKKQKQVESLSLDKAMKLEAQSLWGLGSSPSLKGKSESIVKIAFKNKFGRNPTAEELKGI
jgi:hypothetical protein